jgi:hypothetical protein
MSCTILFEQSGTVFVLDYFKRTARPIESPVLSLSMFTSGFTNHLYMSNLESLIHDPVSKPLPY